MVLNPKVVDICGLSGALMPGKMMQGDSGIDCGSGISTENSCLLFVCLSVLRASCVGLWTLRACNPEGPSTQIQRYYKVPATIPRMVIANIYIHTMIHDIRVLPPSG